MAMKVQVCACVCLHTRTFLNAADKGGIGGEDQTLLEPSWETKDPCLFVQLLAAINDLDIAPNVMEIPVKR